jgi:phage host-nuclease inhibitor protein Gam
MAPEQRQAIPVTQWKEEAFNLPFVIETREQLEAAAHEIADKQIELASLTAKQAKLVGRVQARYAKPIDDLQRAIGAKLDAAYAWCLSNEASEFVDSKTIEFPLASLQFKTCPASVRELPGWTMAKIVAAFRRWSGLRYIRVKFELDKDAILRDRETRKAFAWARRGVEIAHAKSMIITAKKPIRKSKPL